MMQYLPTFLNPWTALLAGAIAVPSLLVLYFLKLRRKEIPIASTILWKKAIQDLQVNSPFQRLRRNLLLLLQLLLLLLLLLALAQPTVFMTPDAGASNVILIDRSASMTAIEPDGRMRLEHAKQAARNLVDTMRRGDVAMVIAFDERAEIAQTFTTDTVALRRAIESIQPTHRRTRLRQAYQLAEAQTNFDPEQLRASVAQPDVWVYSDGRAADREDLGIRANLRYHRIGSASLGNVGVVALSARRNYERPSEVQVFARLANFGEAPVSADVDLHVSPIDPENPARDSFQLRGSARVELIPERWRDAQWVQRNPGARDESVIPRDSVEFTLDLTTAAVLRVGHGATDGDRLAADDVAWVVVPPPRPLRVLLVTEGNYFMERLIQSLNLDEPRIISPAEYEAQIPDDFDVIIFDRAYSPRQLPQGGNFIFFGGLPPGSRLQSAKVNNLPVHLSDVEVLDWQRDHPMLRGLQLSRLFVGDALKLDLPLESQVLVEGVKGPLMVLQQEGRSTNLVIAFDSLESNWPRLVSFPYFMYNALQFMSLGSQMTVRESFSPGDTPRIPSANIQRAGAGLRSIRLEEPGGGRAIPVPESGDFVLAALDHVGVYRTDPVIPQFERLAVNLLDENESNLVPLDHPPGNIGQAIGGERGRSRLDLWWWIVACCALPLLLIEWWVYTRRVHL